MARLIKAPRLRIDERYEGPIEPLSIWRGSNPNGTENPAMEIRILAAHPLGGWLYEWLHQGDADRRCNKQLGHAPEENLRRIFRPAENQPEEASPMAQSDEQRHDDLGAALLGDPDPQRWATAFKDSVLADVAGVDEEVLVGWFANAMQAKETAIEKAAREGSEDAPEDRPHRFSTADLHELVFLVAGAATAPCLAGAPDLVMPTEEVTEGVNAVLTEKGLPVSESRRAGDTAAEEADRGLSEGEPEPAEG